MAAAQTAPEPARSASSLRFLTPRPDQTVIGDATAVLEVTAPPGVEVRELRVWVDDRVTATLTRSPWKAAWNAGDGSNGHTLRAVATFGDGSQSEARTRTSPLMIHEVEEVALVDVYAVAKDASGRYINDLSASDFRVTCDGRPETLERFSVEHKPLHIALVLDTSLSMGGDKLIGESSKVDATRSSALAVLDALEPGDDAMVVTFSDAVQVVQPLTTDRAALQKAIRSIDALGGTALYDAVWSASDALAKHDGRRVLVLLSDGKDEASSGLEPGSLHTLDEALDQALRSEVMVFAIGLGSGIARDAQRLERNPDARVETLDFYGKRSLVRILDDLATKTGGRAIFSSGPSKLKSAFESITQDLRHQYALAFLPDDDRHDGRWRSIGVTSTRPGVRIVHRSGYYAPRDPAFR